VAAANTEPTPRNSSATQFQPDLKRAAILAPVGSAQPEITASTSAVATTQVEAPRFSQTATVTARDTAGTSSNVVQPNHPTPASVGSHTECAYSAHSIAALDRFSKLVGKTISCALVFNNQAPTWATWDDPWFITTTGGDTAWSTWAAASSNRSLIISQSMVPKNPPRDWREQGASGAYDGYIRTFVANLVRAGLGDSVIRLAAEMNGDWNFDNIGSNATDYASWVAYWRHFVTVARAVPGSHLLFDWNVNAAVRPIPFAAYYPGGDVVDIIGVDQYDQLPSHQQPNGPGRWGAIYNAKDGLGSLIQFATKHQKPISFPEWGLVPSRSAGYAGDDPYFVQHMAALIASVNTAYESFWFSSAGGGTLLLTTAPKSTAAYAYAF
jgi:Glycosyl hydrolase family 26